MTPNPTIRLKSVLQTLEHVIVPAVDEKNSLAQEQCGLVLAQLRMLIEHMPHFGSYHELCYRDLADSLATLPAHDGGAQSSDAAKSVSAKLSEAEAMVDRLDAYHLLGHALDDLLRAVRADGAADYRKAVEDCALQFSRRQTLRSRTWFKDSGFDHDPDSLPSLEEMLSA